MCVIETNKNPSVQTAHLFWKSMGVKSLLPSQLYLHGGGQFSSNVLLAFVQNKHILEYILIFLEQWFKTSIIEMILFFILCLGLFAQRGWTTSSWTGRRGAPWSQEEMMMVKAKLVQVLLAHDGGVDDNGNDIVNGGVGGNVDDEG